MKITKKQLEQNIQNLQTKLDQLTTNLKPDQPIIAKIAEELGNNNGHDFPLTPEQAELVGATLFAYCIQQQINEMEICLLNK